MTKDLKSDFWNGLQFFPAKCRSVKDDMEINSVVYAYVVLFAYLGFFFSVGKIIQVIPN